MSVIVYFNIQLFLYVGIMSIIPYYRNKKVPLQCLLSKRYFSGLKSVSSFLRFCFLPFIKGVFGLVHPVLDTYWFGERWSNVLFFLFVHTL